MNNLHPAALWLLLTVLLAIAYYPLYENMRSSVKMTALKAIATGAALASLVVWNYL